MNATLARKLRFSDVVYAINTTPKALRNWLQRKLVELDTPYQQDGTWLDYSFYDIAILALVRKLVDCGIPVFQASDIANEAIKFFPKILHLEKPGEMPAGALAMMWTNRRLYVHRTPDDKWHLLCVALWENPKDPDDTFISINVEAVLRKAFARAWEMTVEGVEDDDTE